RRRDLRGPDRSGSAVGELSPRLGREHRAEAVAEDRLDDEPIRARREPGPDAEIEFPARPEIDVEHREDQVLLLARRTDVHDLPAVAVVPEARRHAGGDVIADLRGRGEAEALTRVVALQRLVDGGIERPVPAADLLIDDRPDLPRPRVRREIAL